LTGTPSILVEGPGGQQTLKVPKIEDLQSAIQAVE
jgi:hypothetical protein